MKSNNKRDHLKPQQKAGKTYDKILSMPIPPGLQDEYLKEVFGVSDDDLEQLEKKYKKIDK